jgi:hypothetical protein
MVAEVRLVRLLIQAVRKAYTKAFPPPSFNDISSKEVDFSGEAASILIKEKLLDGEPFMVGRFGSGELECVMNCLYFKNGLEKYVKYIKGEISSYCWNQVLMDRAFHNSGLFPVNADTLSRFTELMIKDMELVDVLGSWLKNENYFEKQLRNATRVNLVDLDPYNHKEPWTEALTSKKVLVIHPFEESIQKQYKKRDLLFQDKRVLPEFDLKTIKAVQSIANNKSGFLDWFDAFDYMKKRIEETDFEIAIIGCGAYGFPLAAHVKRIGKKAVHLGGATQALFGIIGKRWEENEVGKLINEHWTRPLASEIPENFKSVEKGCYW